ncbi:hypothetical protein RSOLAG22IIIB_04808 [Rhizoctonia solani]|uniref:Transmembrane protein n=1 Tax=Rhizoctonia solani TaxID=456999 RepID=A0A0K6G0J5_9AGAM|nr:hypothetical protein RSOLAG22IIIB_04808 [Rhizoctonia solani]
MPTKFLTIAVALLVVLNVVLVGYDTKFALFKDPNVTRHDYWWTMKYLPNVLQIRDDGGDCEVGKLSQDSTLKTNSTLPLFPYQFKGSYILEQMHNGDTTNITRFVDGPYQANPLSSCFVSEMGLYYEPWWQNFKAIASITCKPTDFLPRFFKFTTSYSASGFPYMRPDSTIEYFTMDVYPDKTVIDFERSLSQGLNCGIDNTSRVNVLGVIDALAGDISQIGWLQFDLLSERERALVPEIAFFGWNLTENGSELEDSGRFQLLTPSPWYTKFSNNANRTMLNFMVAIRDAIHLDLGHVTADNIYLNKTAFNTYIQPNPLYPLVVGKYRRQLDLQVPGICTWTRGCLPNPNITWVEVLREDVGKLPYNDIILPIVQPDMPISVIDMSYLCPIYVRKSWGDLLVSVFSATFSMYGTLYTLFSFVGPKLDSVPQDERNEKFIEP